MPASITATPSGSSRSLEAPRDLAAEAVVAQPGVADARDQDPADALLAHGCTTSTSGAKKNR